MEKHPAPDGRKIVQPAKWGLPYAEDQMIAAAKREQSYIVAIAICTILAWQTEIGTLVLMPFTLLATWYHEMAHGLMAMVLGANFDQLVIYPNGSGYAQYSASASMWDISRALIAAAGLVGPAIVGSGMIIASRDRLTTQLVLAGLGAALLLSTLIWVRSWTGWIVLPVIGVASIWIAFSRRHKLQRFAIEFLGVQAAISIWLHLGYLFVDGGTMDGQVIVSDTGVIADALLLPHWVWGGLITVFVVWLIWRSLRVARKVG